jgi:hypothetical protein
MAASEIADNIIEGTKLIGGIIGIITAIFIVYDRAFRGRPIFALHATKLVAGDNYLFLRIKNVLDEDIVIENWRVEPPNLIGLSTDHSVRAIAGAMVGEIPMAILSPLSELNFTLIILGGGMEGPNVPITVSAVWNNTRRPWPFRRTVKIRTTVARLNDLKGAHQE